MNSKALRPNQLDIEPNIRVGPSGEESNYVASELVADLPEDVAEKFTGSAKFSRGCIRYRVPSGLEVLFLDAELWKTFRCIGTEMIVTNKGRRVFPVPSYIITGLHPERLYNVFIKITPVDNAKHKFLNGVWVQHQENAYTLHNLFEERSTYLHPSSPNTGAHWMSELITFSSLKISNNVGARSSIVLQSMRKYQMSLVISPQFEARQFGDITIPQVETQFVAVTQYQNEKITQMKIEHNPFATSFRSSKIDSSFVIYQNKSRSRAVYKVLSAMERMKKSALTSQDDNDSIAEGSTCEDCNEHLPAMPIHACYRGVNRTPRPFSMVSNTHNSPTHSTTAGPWSSSYTNMQKLCFQSPHTGQIVPNPVASLFPLFHYTNSVVQNVHSSPSFQLGFQQLRQSEHLPMQQRRERATDHESTPDERVSPMKKLLLTEPSEIFENLSPHGKDGTQNQLCEGVKISPNLANRSTLCRLDTQFDGGTRQNRTPNEDQVSSLSVSCLRPEVTLKYKDVWASTQEIVVSEEGRPMYPHLEMTVSNMVHDCLYSCHLELVLATPWSYEYEHGEWTPSTTAEVPQVSGPPINLPWHQHSDNPKPGRHWENHGISFEGLQLATNRQGKNKIKVQLRRQYFPVLKITTDSFNCQYPLRAATFVSVSIDRTKLTGHIDSIFQQNKQDLPFYPNLREPFINAHRNSLGRKQALPKKTKASQGDAGTSDHSMQSSPISGADL